MTSAPFKEYLAFRWSPFLWALATLLLLHLIGRAVVHDGADYFVQRKDDLRGRQSQMYAREQAGHTPTAYFFGGSGMMWSLPAETQVTDAGGQHYTLRNYAYGFQSLPESYTLLEKLPLGQGDTVVIHLSPSRVNRAEVEERLRCRPYMYTVTALDITRVYDEMGIESAANPLCYVSFLTQGKLIQRVLTQRLHDKPVKTFVTHIPQDFEASAEALEQKRKEILRAQLWSDRDAFRGRWLEVDDDAVATARQVLEKMRAYVQGHGARLVLIDLPLNRAWFERHFGWGADKEAHYRLIGARLRADGFDYHDWRWDQRFAYDDFYDHQHMVQSGRDKVLPLYQGVIAGTTSP